MREGNVKFGFRNVKNIERKIRDTPQLSAAKKQPPPAGGFPLAESGCLIFAYALV